MYYFVLCVEGNPNERNEKTSYVCIYICVWCVCVSICMSFIMYLSMVIGSVWHSWQVFDVILLLHSGPEGSAARYQR